MNTKIYLIFSILIVFCIHTRSIASVNSFRQLGIYHCQNSPVQLLYRLATGQISEIYGAKYTDLDCYIRQFVNKDGQDTFEYEQQQDEEQEQQQEQDQSKFQQQQAIPQNDPLVLQYAQGISKCLPSQADPVQAVYAIWRFYRFVVQHDYALEWMRAKIRASLGYTAQKPSSWMDGEQSAPRLRLDKLFSNQFYDYVDQLMFKDFLHPIMTFLKKNLVFAASGQITKSGKAILIQYIQTKNLREKFFLPVIYRDQKAGNIFSYTIPGTPLLLGGSSSKISWAFTGVLVDRSNVQQIQTLGQKFFHHDSQTWIKLQNVTEQIKVKNQQTFECKFVHSTYGTLYQKRIVEKGKVSEYIARWHQKQKKVRVLFSEILQLVRNEGQATKQMQFPFSSLVLTNSTGIYQYLCFQKHPSYFIYPDLSSPPEPSKVRWVSNPKRNFLIVSNTHLTTMNQGSYIKRETLNPTQQQFQIDVRKKLNVEKFDLQTLTQFVHSVNTDPLIKQRKDYLIYIYRKAKFLFFPDDKIRKECDQLVAFLQRWDHDLNSKSISPVFILWDYFFKEYTFNYASKSEIGRNIAKHKALTDSYWTYQMQLWKVGTSYGECDSNEWQTEMKKKLNGTGDNSTCFFNIMRGINRTRQILRSEDGAIKQPLLADFVQKKLINLENGYLGTHIEEAFSHFFSKNIAFSAQIDNQKIIYMQGYQQQKLQIDLSQQTIVQTIQQQKHEQNKSQDYLKDDL